MKKIFVIALAFLMVLLMMAVPAVLAETNINFEGIGGSIKIESWGGGHDRFTIGGGHFAGWQTIESGSMHIEREAGFEGYGGLSAFSELGDTSMQAWANGYSGSIDQSQPTYVYPTGLVGPNGVTFDTSLTYHKYYMEVTSASDYEIGTYAQSNEDAKFWMEIEGDGNAELYGTNIIVGESPWTPYDYVSFRGDGQTLQGGAANGEGDFSFGTYGEDQIRWDFRFVNDGTLTTTLMNVDGEALTDIYGDFDTGFSFSGHGYALETP